MTRFTLILLLMLASCGSGSGNVDKAPVAGKLDGFNLLFVTLDTTRADHLGCYGHDEARTPTLDALAEDGVRFERAHTGVPLTLPSHCSMMTGRYPKEHGVRDNGRKSLSKALPTLAEAFSQRGYATGAFVASFVLASRFGVNRGFDTYLDDLGKLAQGEDLLHQEIPANEVTDRALSWLEARNGKRFFCWVHYFDAHDPYVPPAGFKDFKHPYDGELAYIDSQLARIVDWLDDSGQRDNTLIVITGDHGESFGEHGRDGHIIFLYGTNLHVPLILNQPSVLPQGRVADDLVELVDLFPTLHDLYGWEAPSSLLSRSLVPAIDGAQLSERAIYGENEYVTSAYGWAQQRSLTTGKWKYISSTIPELYDLQADPGETNNLAASKPDLALDLRNLLAEQHAAMVAGNAEDVEMDAAAQAAIAKLGYGGSGTTVTGDDFLTEGLPDPKEMLPSLTSHKRGKQLMARGDLEGAISAFKRAIRVNPKSTLMLYDLAIAYLDSGRALEAAQALEKALQADPRYMPALVSMGEALTALGRPAEAAKQYEAALLLVENSPEVHAVLASVLKSIDRKQDALTHFQSALEHKPGWIEVQLDIAVLHDELGQSNEAIAAYELVLNKTPQNHAVRVRLAEILATAGRIDEATTQLQSALEVAPKNDTLIEALARHFRRQGQGAQALALLRKSQQAIPSSLRIANALARLLATSTDDALRNGTEALAMATEFCRQNRNQSPSLLSTLAAAQAENGQFQEAISTIKSAATRAKSGTRLARQLDRERALYSAGQPLRGTQK